MNEPVSIILDTTITSHSRGGVGRYILRLADALRRIAPTENVSFRTIDVPAARPGTPAPAFTPDIVLTDPLYLSVPVIRRIPIGLGSELHSRRDRLNRLLGDSGVFHHSGVQPIFPAGWTSVVTHFDSSALKYPEWHTAQTVAYAERERVIIEAGSRILAISEWAALEAESYFGLESGSVGIATGAADPLYTPGEPDTAVLACHDLEADSYILHVGSFVPRKNIPFMLDVYRGCLQEGFDLPLVMVGAEEWRDAAPETDEPWVRRLHVPEDGDLLHIYRGARAVLLPSIYEGLGFPALEAMACRRPLLCSNAAALRGTVGRGGVLLDPLDRVAWGRAIMSLLDPQTVSSLEEKAGSEIRRTWDGTATEAIDFYLRISP
jgi:glycosyltransferase involved in cell wall biosynthesis